MSLKCKDKVKSLIELTSAQNNTVLSLAKKRKLYKVDIIRRLIDTLDGLEGDVYIIAYDKKNLSILNNFTDVMNLEKSDNITDFTLNCKYSRKDGVQCDLNFYTSISFGGECDDQKD
jgi:hypothetical protein